MSMTLIIILITYIISTVYLYVAVIVVNKLNEEEGHKSEKITAYFIIFTPSINSIFVIISAYIYADDKLDISGKVEERWSQIKYNWRERQIKRLQKGILRKERKEKIRLGIIRISKNDPYGEENWNE